MSLIETYPPVETEVPDATLLVIFISVGIGGLISFVCFFFIVCMTYQWFRDRKNRGKIVDEDDEDEEELKFRRGRRKLNNID